MRGVCMEVVLQVISTYPSWKMVFYEVLLQWPLMCAPWDVGQCYPLKPTQGDCMAYRKLWLLMTDKNGCLRRSRRNIQRARLTLDGVQTQKRPHAIRARTTAVGTVAKINTGVHAQRIQCCLLIKLQQSTSRFPVDLWYP